MPLSLIFMTQIRAVLPKLLVILGSVLLLHAMPPYQSPSGDEGRTPYQPEFGAYPQVENSYPQRGEGQGYGGSRPPAVKQGGLFKNREEVSYSEKSEKRKKTKEEKSKEEEDSETKYYYGGKFTGSCTVDGLYYRDDTTFVICSNGYPHAQPCPPGTRTAGYPRYKAGYYYGYTDLCSVNLVDFGYGPEYYAPKGYPKEDEEGEGDREGGDRKKKTEKVNYSSSSSSSSSSSYDNYRSKNQGAYEIRQQNSYQNSNSGFGGYENTRPRGDFGPPMHYSSHLGQNKQGGEGYGIARGAEPYPGYPGRFGASERGYPSRNSGPTAGEKQRNDYRF